MGVMLSACPPKHTMATPTCDVSLISAIKRLSEVISPYCESFTDAIHDGVSCFTDRDSDECFQTFLYEVVGAVPYFASIFAASVDWHQEVREHLGFLWAVAKSRIEARHFKWQQEFEAQRAAEQRAKKQAELVAQRELDSLRKKDFENKHAAVRSLERAPRVRRHAAGRYVEPKEVEDYAEASAAYARTFYNNKIVERVVQTGRPLTPPRVGVDYRVRAAEKQAKMAPRVRAAKFWAACDKRYKPSVPEKELERAESRFGTWMCGLLKATVRLTSREVWARDQQVSVQCGGDKASRRALREAEQRRAARLKAEAKRKSVPKAEREAAIKAARDKRTPLYEWQGGKIISAAAIGALGTVTVGLVKGVRGIASKVGDLINQAQTVSGALKKNLGGLLGSLESMVTAFKKIAGRAIWFVPMALVLYYVFQMLSLPLPFLVTVFGVIGLSIFGKALWNRISEFFRDRDGGLSGTLAATATDPEVETQSGTTSALAKLAATLLAFSVFGKSFKPSNVTEFCKRISMLDRMSGGWECFIKWVTSAIECTVNFVRERCGYDRVKLFNKAKDRTAEWMTEVDEMQRVYNTAEAPIDVATINKMIKLVNTGFELKTIYMGNPELIRPITVYLNTISSLLSAHLGSVNARNNYRFEPAMVCFLGDPGIGKSMMAVPFCAALLLESGLMPPGSTADEVTSQIFQKDNGDYWNGYDNQLVNVMDDIFQQRADVSDKENEYMTLIRAIGSWSFPLNMADVSSKGKYYYTSKIVFATTNVRSIHSEAAMVLNEPGAVARRIAFPYELRLVKEYATPEGRLDLVKFEQERRKARELGNGIDRFPWYVWEARYHNFLTGETSGAVVPMRDLLGLIVEGLKARLNSFAEGRVAIDDFIGGFKVQSGKVISPFAGLDKKLSGDVEDGGADVAEQKERLDAKARFAKFSKIAIQDVCQDTRKERVFLKLAAVGFGLVVAMRMLIFLAKQLTALLAAALGAPVRAFRKFKNRGVKVQSNHPLRVRATKAVKPNNTKLQAGDVTVVANVYANTYKMSVPVEEGQYHYGQVCFVNSTLAVQPEHFTCNVKEQLQDGVIKSTDELRFANVVNPAFNFKVRVSDYLALPRLSEPNNDVEFLNFVGLGIRAHRNISGSFLRDNEMEHAGGCAVRLDVANPLVVMGKETLEHRVYTSPRVHLKKNLMFGERKMERYFTYAAPTRSGDCGAPLSLMDNTSYSGRTVLGFHVAGKTRLDVGIACIVSQKMVEDAIKRMSIIDDNFASDLKDRGVELQSGDQFPFPEMGSFLPVGVLDKPITICPKTSYFVNQGYYGVFGEYNYRPAPMRPVLRDGELVYPMLNAVKPYSTEVKVIADPDFAQVMHTAFSKHMLYTAGRSRKLYSFEEAILGIPNEKFRSLPRNTAPGFPYCYDFKDGKKSFFGTKQDYDLDNDNVRALRVRVEHVLAEAKHGRRCAHVFLDFLKDELRSEVKVRNVATRLISCAPMDYTIAWRMMFGAFASATMHCHTVSGMAPGISCFTDWPMLAEEISSKGDKVFDGDFTGFDASEQPTVLSKFLDYINAWYNDGEENALIRRVLWEDLIHSRHVGGPGTDQRYIYQWNKSLPSGHPFTTIVNSMYSLFALTFCYTKLTGDRVGFWDNVGAATYGDDNVVNPSDEVAEVFNQVTIVEPMRDYLGLTYTSGKKDGRLEKYTDLSDVTFLKRGFVPDGTFCNAPLAIDSFLYSVYWSKNKKLRLKITRDELENALEELSMHPQRVWDLYAIQIGELIDELGHVTKCPLVREEYLRHVRTRVDSWY